jgi:hypothetical protein
LPFWQKVAAVWSRFVQLAGWQRSLLLKLLHWKLVQDSVVHGFPSSHCAVTAQHDPPAQQTLFEQCSERHSFAEPQVEPLAFFARHWPAEQ